MIRQSQNNRSGSSASEFQKSMLTKLDSLCSPSPTFDSVDSESSVSFSLSNTSANTRKRRLYHSPGSLGNLQSPVNSSAAAALAAREEKVKNFGNVLAERARLVQKTLTRNAIASQKSSTPIRPGSSILRSKNTAGSERFLVSAASHCDSATPARPRTKKFSDGGNDEKSENMTATSWNALESTRVQQVLMDIAEESDNYDRLLNGCRDSQSSAGSSVGSLRLLRNSGKTHSRSTQSDSSEIDSLQLTKIPLKRKRKDRNVQWFAVVCSTIKRLINFEPSSYESGPTCACLEMALVATKKVSCADDDWHSSFAESITQLLQVASKCSFHRRCVRPLSKQKKVNLVESQRTLDDESSEIIIKWLQESRPLILERIASNIQLLT